MAKDIQQWKSKDILSDDERLLIKRCLGFFAGAESLVSNNLLISIFKKVVDPEARQYILRQANEEATHNWTLVYICDSLNLSVDEVFKAYVNIPSIAAKDNFLLSAMLPMSDRKNHESDIEYKQRILTNIIIYYIICEGIFFYSGFAMLLALGRQNKMPGIAEQISYVVRDEGLHINFGVELINKIKRDYPTIWTEEYQKNIIDYIKIATDLELKYVDDVLPRGILGLNKAMFVDYMQYIANRRFEAIGLNYRFPKDVNSFAWMSESIELDKNKNFFESRVTNYQLGALEDDL